MATKMSFAFEEAHRLLVELINIRAIFRIITNYNLGGHRKLSVQFDWFVFHMYVLRCGWWRLHVHVHLEFSGPVMILRMCSTLHLRQGFSQSLTLTDWLGWLAG